MAFLLTREGNIVEGGLSGTTSVNGVDVTTAGASRTTIHFPYTDLAILVEGAYKIRVDVYKVAYDNTDGYDFQEHAKSSRVTVVNEAVPAVPLSAASSELSRPPESISINHNTNLGKHQDAKYSKHNDKHNNENCKTADRHLAEAIRQNQNSIGGVED
ncbi:hypothetical protein FOXB_10910 [Fusarium oxysporum f. sp. conglutinans Fo5176]|uniref:Velvet domain-containing protein n=1 Tax=Fusarium oxysporum (strain Fo5176) TaxID=660025 RepID=F9FWX8_FUSOF|nr:hypothetical protein FOXB_10910 [Fusarium oxysporum f. sp. conglutinans Fo5176]